jgi:hypothetical protein
MYRTILFFLVLNSLLASCKSDTKKEVKKELSKKEQLLQQPFPEATKDNSMTAYVATNPNDNPLQEPKTTYEETKVPSMQELRNQGESIFTKRMSDKAEPIAALDVSRWGYDGEFNNGKFTDKIEGRWLDFSEKMTYTYGDQSGKKGGGKYHYDNDTHLLLVLDDNKSIKPVEYKIKIVNDALVLMGQATYGDGGYQAKLTRQKK